MSNEAQLSHEQLRELLEAEVKKLNQRSRRASFFGELSINLERSFPSFEEAEEAKERFNRLNVAAA